MKRLKDAWTKNGPELLGLLNGALPDFVIQRRPADKLSGVPVFCYHLVESAGLEADLEHLSRNGYRTLTGSELAEYLRRERELSEPAVLLSFDDGAFNFFEVALPLLLKFRMRATVFIAPGLHREASRNGDGSPRPMSWEEIGEARRSGLVSFQSHTLESRYVPEWPLPVPLAGCAAAVEAARRGPPLDMLEDFRRSRELLEARLGTDSRVTQLAFPRYQGSEAGIAAARAAGFEACCWGLLPGRALNRPGDSPFHITRCSDEFLRRLPGTGRISRRTLLANRLRRIRAARNRS
jgi:peptidoglycan/xylan/chitin deacetylase (PgdA/CDA1 family)